MSARTDALWSRLDAIACSLSASGHGLALLALGSAGRETFRLDDHSDLDFFAIVEPGHKKAYLEDPQWLTGIAPVTYQFRNTVDGYKILYADGIFCECAVFEPDELPAIPFAPGRLVWKRPGVPETLAQPVRPGGSGDAPDPAWLVGEALTNLYVGLCRLARGEVLSATRFIQHHAVDQVLKLAVRWAPASAPAPDPFAIERRVEQRQPDLARWLPRFVPGYAHNREAASAVLEFLEQHTAVPPALAAHIRSLNAAAAAVRPDGHVKNG